MKRYVPIELPKSSIILSPIGEMPAYVPQNRNPPTPTPSERYILRPLDKPSKARLEFISE